MSTIPYSASARPTATPEAVAAYCEQHTTLEAADYFGVSDRYIRKQKAKHVPAKPSTQIGATVPQRAAEALSTPILPIAPNAPEKPAYATINAGAIADSDCLWKCPHCGEWMHPTPKTTGEQWAIDGCYMCHSKRSAPFIMSGKAVPASGTNDAPTGGTAEPEAEPELEEIRPSLVVPPEPEPVAAAPSVGTGTMVPPPVIYRDRVVTRVVRVPVEPQRSSVVALVQQHMPPIQVIVALLIALALVGVASLG